MGEAELRSAFKRQLLDEEIRNPQTMVLDELGILNGSVRVDVAVINGLIHGFELKSKADTLERLPRQMYAYGRVLDRATLVTADCHLKKCVALLPPWWGIVAVSEGHPDPPCRTIRAPKPNPSPNALDIARLLWRKEALDILTKLGLAGGVRSKSRLAVQERLAESLDIEVLKFTVRRYLRHRQDWRSAAPQT